MTRINRIENFLIGLLMIAGSIALAINPEESLPVITAIMSVSLWIYGIRMMVYYLTMARHMVGGLRVLFRAILMLDLGYFAMGLTEIPLLYVMLYLAVMVDEAGGIHIRSRSTVFGMYQSHSGLPEDHQCLRAVEWAADAENSG